MSMNSFARVALLGVLMLAGPAWSQERKCNVDEETIADCVDRVVLQGVATVRGVASENAAPDTREAVAKASGNEAAKDDQAGASTGTGKASSTFTDLLPWFNALGLLSDSDSSDGTVAVDLNFLLFQRKRATHDSQLKWVFDISPEPFEPLIAALPEDVQEARKKSLQEKIDDTADSEIQYTWSLVNGRFGRDFRPHYAQIASLAAPVIANAGAAGDNDLRSEAQARFGAGFVNLRKDLARTKDGEAAATAARAAGESEAAAARAGRRAATAAVDDRPMSAFTGDERVKIEAFINAQLGDLTVQMAKHLDSIAAAIKDDRIDALTRLVLLQPQLTFSLNRQIRDELVGPEATGFKVTFEKSFIDLNAFLDSKSAGASCSKLKNATTSTALSFDEADTCLTAVGQYIESNTEQLDNESRWLASLEYKQVDSWQYALPDDGVTMDRPKYDRIVASAGFGRALPRSAVKDRVDFEASYDSNLDSDDNYKSRFVVTLTYTRRFNDMDIPFSIVYANKSEFLEGTDKQIGVHVGVKFRGVEKAK